MANIATTTLLKFQRLAKRLGIPAYATLGVLETLWQYVHLQAQDEIGVRFSPGDVELIIGWDGAPGVLEAALLEFRWLDRDGDGALIIHDYPANMPPFVRKRFERKAAKKREKEGDGQDGVTGQPPDDDQSLTSQGPNMTGEGSREEETIEEETRARVETNKGGGGEGIHPAALEHTGTPRKTVADKVREILAVTGEPPECFAYWETNIRAAVKHDKTHGTCLYAALAEAVAQAGREEAPAASIINIIAPAFHAHNVPLAHPPQETTPPSDRDAAFERFWSAYPCRLGVKPGKTAARKAWAKLDPVGGLLDTIMAAVEAQKNSRDWLKENGKYIPHASTWLNNARWEDETTETQTCGDGSPVPWEEV